MPSYSQPSFFWLRLTRFSNPCRFSSDCSSKSSVHQRLLTLSKLPTHASRSAATGSYAHVESSSARRVRSEESDESPPQRGQPYVPLFESSPGQDNPDLRRTRGPMTVLRLPREWSEVPGSRASERAVIPTFFPCRAKFAAQPASNLSSR